MLTLRADVITEIEDYAITQNLQSLRNRVNELGVSEPLVQRTGRDRIVLDLPGIQDSTRRKSSARSRTSNSASNRVGMPCAVRSRPSTTRAAASIWSATSSSPVIGFPTPRSA